MERNLKKRRQQWTPPTVWRLAILESLKSDAATAAGLFEVDEQELRDRELLFLLETQHERHRVALPAEPEQPHWLQTFYGSVWYDLGMKVFLTLSLAAMFYVIPQVLKEYVDPLSNTIVWSGFTTLYLLSFISLGIELIFWACHNVNFRFFNRLYDPGVYDYESFLRSDKLTHYEKCQINQQKYLAYFAGGLYILSALLNLIVPS